MKMNEKMNENKNNQNTTEVTPLTPTTPQLFNNSEHPEFGTLRVLTINNDPWFVGKDVAEALGYKLARKAITDHADEKDVLKWNILTNGGKQQMTIINESGLYSLILSSKLPTAKKFKHWVTSEILPTIRKTGGYVANADTFLNTYLPFADEQTCLLFRTTLQAITNLNGVIKNQKETIEQQQHDLDYKQEIIQNYADTITLADKRQILNRVMRHNNGNFQNRWYFLYREFENKYHMNLDARLDNYNLVNKPKLKNKLDYIDKVLGMIDELYDIAVKLYESDVQQLIDQIYKARGIELKKEA